MTALEMIISVMNGFLLGFYTCTLMVMKDRKELKRIMETALKKERKTGKWIRRHYVCEDGNLDTFICSECRYECCYDAETGVSAEDYKYCPNCGAKMEADDE